MALSTLIPIAKALAPELIRQAGALLKSEAAETVATSMAQALETPESRTKALAETLQTMTPQQISQAETILSTAMMMQMTPQQRQLMQVSLDYQNLADARSLGKADPNALNYQKQFTNLLLVLMIVLFVIAAFLFHTESHAAAAAFMSSATTILGFTSNYWIGTSLSSTLKNDTIDELSRDKVIKSVQAKRRDG